MTTDTETTVIPSSLSISAPNPIQLMQKADQMLEDARSIVIDSDDMQLIAGAELQAIKGQLDSYEEQRTGITGPINTALRAINALFKPATSRLEEAEKIIKAAMLGYDQKKEQEAAEARKKAQAEADAERLKSQQEAEQRRAEAEAAEAAGDTATADRLQAEADAAEQTASLVVAAPVVAAPIRVAGTSVRKTWKARLPENDAEKLKLLAFIVANPQYISLVDVSQKEANKLASALKQHMKIDGITAYEDRNLAASAR